VLSIGTKIIDVGTATIAPSSVVRDLGIYLDSNLSMTAHISKTVSNCFSAMRLIRSVRRSVSKAVLLSLVTLLVLSRVDYGNATLAGLHANFVGCSPSSTPLLGRTYLQHCHFCSILP